MKISFDTTSYTNANGSAPKGRNSYAFRVISVDGFAPDSDEIHFAPMMTPVSYQHLTHQPTHTE